MQLLERIVISNTGSINAHT